MTATTSSASTAIAVTEPVFTSHERLALAGFLAGYTGLTREAYALDLRQYASWCQQRHLRLFGARRADIECFAPDMEARGRARSTITRRLCTIAGFYRYAVEEDLIEHSPAAHVRRPRVDYESHATGLGRNELGAILVAAGLGGPAEHALISLLALNGLRVSEATGANIEALGTERGHRTLTITRKGGKVVTIPLAPRTARAIDLAIGERSDGPLFLVPDGRRLDRHGAARIVRRAADRAGTPSRSGRTRSATRSSPPPSMPASRCAMFKRPPPTPTRGPRSATTVPAAAWTGTPPTSSRPMSREHPGSNWLPGSGLRLPGPQRPGGGPAATRASQHFRRRSRRRTDTDRQPLCPATGERRLRRTTTGTRMICGPGAATVAPGCAGWNAARPRIECWSCGELDARRQTGAGMPLPKVAGQWNKTGLNHLTRHIAPWMPGFGVVVHRSRRSGRCYQTPVNVFRAGDGYVIALTYGPQTDRVKNVLAAGGCELRPRCQAIPLGPPRLFHDQSRAAIRPVERQVPGILHVADFLSLTPTPASPAAPGQSPP